jgi:tyrosine-protein phosphatase YwqE
MTTLKELKEEVEKELFDLIKEGHEAIINHEEVDEYRAKVKSFLYQFIEKSYQLGREEVVGEIEKTAQEYFSKMININNGKLPYVIFGGKADENEKITLYKSGFDDLLKLITSFNNKSELTK